MNEKEYERRAEFVSEELPFLYEEETGLLKLCIEWHCSDKKPLKGKTREEFVELATQAIERYVGERIDESDFRDREEDCGEYEASAEWVAAMYAERGREYGRACLEEYLSPFSFFEEDREDWINGVGAWGWFWSD